MNATTKQRLRFKELDKNIVQAKAEMDVAYDHMNIGSFLLAFERHRIAIQDKEQVQKELFREGNISGFDESVLHLIKEKAFKQGDYTLHSGEKSGYLFDIMELIGDVAFLNEFKKFVKEDTHLVGIEFGGAILAAMSGKPFSIIRKDGNIYGDIPSDYTLLDDVVTTENSISNAISYIEKNSSTYSMTSKKIKTIVDRRKTPILKIESMVLYV